LIDSKTKDLYKTNISIERAVDDLINSIEAFPIDPHVTSVSRSTSFNVKK
jgi:hypothetical protein